MTTILITGAGRGIGYEIARQALDKDWKVIGSVRTVEAQRALAEKLPKMAVLNFDVTDHKAIEKVANAFHSPIDILVNNAGILGPDREKQTTSNMDFEGFAKVLETNVLSPLKIAQVFMPLLKQGNNPKLINISSKMGRMEFSTSDILAYRASKAALNKITQALATDLREDGVACIAMHPGWVQSDMGGATADITPEQSAAGILQVIQSLTVDDTGKFIDWDGTPRSW